MLSPADPSQWSLYDAAHLLGRAGFGGSPDDIRKLYALGMHGAVDSLLAGDEDADLFPAPGWAQPANLLELKQRFQAAADPMQKQMLIREVRADTYRKVEDLRTWWLNRMRYTTFPLREKATLFWHGHFATGVDKARDAYMLWTQNETLRANALGNFGAMTREISRDPAMMRYLDTDRSKPEHPNENFARELMELFTLGEGNYTEQDIRQSARAFTGYRIDPLNEQFMFLERQHDGGVKEFFGRTGNFSGDDIIGIILDQPVCGEFMARKLWTFFAYDNPEPELVTRLGRYFHDTGYDIKKTLIAIFLSREFYSPKAMRTQVKSPVQWMVQTSRALEIPLPDAIAMNGALSQMGQVLFAPPNVKGWDGGRAWITTGTLLYRYNLSNYIVSGKAPALDGLGGLRAGTINVDIDKVVPPEIRSDPDKVCDAVAFRLFNTTADASGCGRFMAYLKTHTTPSIEAPAIRDFLQLMMSTPEYQLT